jgi:hypothetical protein
LVRLGLWNRRLGMDRVDLYLAATPVAIVIYLATQAHSFSPFISLFLSIYRRQGAYSGKLMVWDTKTRALIRTLEGPEDVEWLDWHSKGGWGVDSAREGSID